MSERWPFFEPLKSFFQRLERLILYAIILLLVSVIAWPVWSSRSKADDGGDGKEGPGIDDEMLLVIKEEILDALRNALSTHNAKLGNVEGPFGQQLTEIDTELERGRARTETLQTTMAAIQGALAGIEPRIAQATCDRLKPEMCTDVTDGTGEMQRGPLALLVKSNFTLLFENARLDEIGDVSERSAGIRLTPAHQRRLDAIVRAFRPCNTGRRVEFKIHGFSSTAEFQARSAEGEEPLRETDNLNLETAKLRAKVVADYLSEREFTAEPVEISPDLDAMARPYVDDAVSGETDQEGLNRSVFIEVVSAGACGQSAQ